jgi:hypothetical protein
MRWLVVPFSLFYTGGTYNNDPSLSLGGVQPQDHVRTPGDLYDPIHYWERPRHIDHRCIDLEARDNMTSITLWLEQPNDGIVELAWQGKNNATTTKTDESQYANIVDNPGVSADFAEFSEINPLSASDLGAGDYHRLWFRRRIGSAEWSGSTSTSTTTTTTATVTTTTMTGTTTTTTVDWRAIEFDSFKLLVDWS